MAEKASSTRPIEHSLATVYGETASLRALIVLNGPTLPARLFRLLTTRAPPRTILADGAADNLRHNFPTFVPTHIAGDLDSASEETLSHYRALGVNIHKDGDQYTNDFEKSLAVAVDTPGTGPMAVVGGHDGRFDQTLANLNVLLSATSKGVHMVWLQPYTAVIALSPGTHIIKVDPTREGPACGLLPVFTPVETVTTTGLRWNLSHQPLSFGGLISSSNIVERETITVETSHPIIWTIELRITE